MYVCICNAIRESDFRAAARAHPELGAEALYGSLGKQPQCRQCLEEADRIRDEERFAGKLPMTVGH